MTEPSIPGFFSGFGKSAKFPSMGSTVEGVIKKVHPPEQQKDYDTQQLIPGKFQVRIELETDERDPEDAADDGVRTLYVRGWMQGAIGDALRKAGVVEPEVGAKLSVTWSGTAPPTNPRFQGAHQYTAVYTPSGGFFNAQAQAAPAAAAGNGSQPAQAPIPDQPPAGIDPAAWQQMPDAAKQAIANVAAGLGN